MAQLTPHFCANRTVREYTEQHYLPTASAYLARAADKGTNGVKMVNWRYALEQKWIVLRFGEIKIETNGGQHIFEVQVYLDDLDPEAVRIALYANGANSEAPVRVQMERVRQLVGAINGHAYSQRFKREITKLISRMRQNG